MVNLGGVLREQHKKSGRVARVSVGDTMPRDVMRFWVVIGATYVCSTVRYGWSIVSNR
jgi:hypothetical protein